MANLKKIKDIAKGKRIQIRELSERIGITEAGLHGMIKSGSMKVEVLEKIAKELEVPMTIFLDDTGNYTGNNIAVGHKVSQRIDNGQVDALRRDLDECKKEVALLRKIINLMEKEK